MSATTSTVRKDRLVKEDKRDVAHVQRADDGRKQPLDNVSQWLALQALRVRPASTGADPGKISNPGRDKEFPHLHAQHR